MLRILSRFLPEGIRRTLRTLKSWLFGAIGVGLCIGAVVMLYDPLSTIINTGSVPEDIFRPLFIPGVMLFIGVGFVYTAVTNYRREKVYEEIEDMEEPWTAREAWQSSTLTHENSQSWGFFTTVFLGGGGALAGWIIWTAIITAETPEWPALFVLIFPLAGVFMAVQMVKAYRRRQRFGISEAELETMPGRLGERFLAQVHARIDRDELPEHGAQVQLSCYRRSARYETTGSGDNKKRTAKEKKRLLWRGEKQMRPMSYDADGALIPVSFQVPDDMPESTAMKRSKKYLARTGKSDFMWVLTVRAELPGIDYRSRFEVPVYESDDNTSTNGTASASLQKEHEAEDASEPSEKVMWDLERDEEALQVDSGEAEATTDDPYAEYVVEPNLTEPISKNISIERLGGRGIRVHMKPDRSLKGIGLLAFLVVFGIGMTVGSVFAFGANFLGGAIFLFFGIVCLWAAWSTWHREVIISVSDGEVDIQTEGGAGQGGRFPATEVEDIKVLISGNESSSNYEIAVQKRASGDGLDSGTAKGVMDTMGQVLGEEATGKMKEKMSEAKNRVAHLDGLHNKQEADWIAEQLREAVEAEKRYA
ncbi:hypothetical protein CRI93_13120 [Longimonas halophila]|uniref:Uncharacterized protein n=1 Tax=Longimonas halophila TaxID=1469170 RepID=A0A2H3NLN6_9BACT|nr:hypothetical protein [Longimonas halophila]PEN05449.1 hypothetical protein CRI93_13120 [Longimonas halophila]